MDMGGATLYDEMYTEYGPFYYVAHSAVFKSVGWDGTHDQLRLVSVVMWGLVAIAWALCVWIWRHSVAWSLTAMMTTVVVLRALKWEPGHPQILILLLYGFVFMATSLYTKKSGSAMFAVLGAACAALLLTKINIGLFVCVPLAVAFTASLAPERRPRGLRAAVSALCIALPAVLMHRQFTAPAVIVQCAVFSFGIWALLDRGLGNSPQKFPRAAGIWAAIGFASLGLLTLSRRSLTGPRC